MLFFPSKNKRKISTNFIFKKLFFALLLCMAILWIAYSLYGHQLVRAIYEGRSIEILNRTIEGRHENPLEYYYLKADVIFIGFLILFSIFIISFGIFKLFLRLSSPDLFIAASIFPAFLISGALAVKKILEVPFLLWNAHRLAWTFSLLNGYNMYYGPHNGPVLGSRMYGPFACLAYLPVTLLNSPTAALILGSCISACFYFLPVLWLHIGKEALDTKKLLFGCCAFTLFCLVTFKSGVLSFSASIIHADAPALGMGALASAILYYRKHKYSVLPLFLASLVSVFAVWTKQTLAPILFALPVYVLLADGYKCFKRYILCLAVSGVTVSAVFLWIFNAQDLFFNMITYIAVYPWKFGPSRMAALLKVAFLLGKECFLFAAVLIFYSLHGLSALAKRPDKLKTWFNANPWMILAIVSLFMVPASILGYVKVGGSSNTLSPTLYFLVGAFTMLLMKYASNLPHLHGRLIKKCTKLLLILLTIGLICVNMPELRNIPIHLRNLPSNNQNTAYEYAKSHPGETYFPLDPLATLLSEGKLYHFTKAIEQREATGFRISHKHFRAHIPGDIKQVAFCGNGNTLRLIKEYLPEFSRQISIDELPGWTVYTRE